MDATHAQGRGEPRQADKVGLSHREVEDNLTLFFRASHKLCTDDCSLHSPIQCSQRPGCKVSLWLFAVVAWSIIVCEDPDVLGVALSEPAAAVVLLPFRWLQRSDLICCLATVWLWTGLDGGCGFVPRVLARSAFGSPAWRRRFWRGDTTQYPILNYIFTNIAYIGF